MTKIAYSVVMTHEAGLMLSLLGAHYFGDWYFQSRDMAMNKSRVFQVLLQHLAIVTLTLTTVLVFVYNGLSDTLALKLFINAIIHGIIDWNIWKGYKARVRKDIKNSLHYPSEEEINQGVSKYPYWINKRFYDTIGFDQFLHVATLAILFL